MIDSISVSYGLVKIFQQQKKLPPQGLDLGIPGLAIEALLEGLRLLKLLLESFPTDSIVKSVKSKKSTGTLTRAAAWGWDFGGRNHKHHSYNSALGSF